MLPNTCLHMSYPVFREDVQKWMIIDHPCSLFLSSPACSCSRRWRWRMGILMILSDLTFITYLPNTFSPMFPSITHQPVHVQGWGGGGWEHWWLYPNPCSASSPCQAVQFITNSALTGEVYDAAAAFFVPQSPSPVCSWVWTLDSRDNFLLTFLLVCLWFRFNLNLTSLLELMIIHFHLLHLLHLFISKAGEVKHGNIDDWTLPLGLGLGLGPYL